MGKVDAPTWSMHGFRFSASAGLHLPSWVRKEGEFSWRNVLCIFSPLLSFSSHLLHYWLPLRRIFLKKFFFAPLVSCCSHLIAFFQKIIYMGRDLPFISLMLHLPLRTCHKNSVYTFLQVCIKDIVCLSHTRYIFSTEERKYSILNFFWVVPGLLR